MWFEARVWPTIHRTVPTHSCKEAAEKNSIFFRRNTEEAERRGRRVEMKRRWGREAGRGKESDSARASHG